MIAGVKSQPDYSARDAVQDVVLLLQTVKKLFVGIDTNENEAVTALDALTKYYTLRQADAESNEKHLERFKSVWKTVEIASGEECLVPKFVITSDKYTNMQDEEWKEAIKAIHFFTRANRMRFETLLREVSAGVVLGVDNYPTSIDQAFCILTETSYGNSSEDVWQ